MNDSSSTPVPPPIQTPPPLQPPQIPLQQPPQYAAIPPLSAARQPLGATPEEREHVSSPIGAVEALLRQPRRLMYQLRQPGAGPLIMGMVLVALLCSLVYGLVVGTFSGGMQLWAAPLKVAGGLLVSALICLPSLYIFTCLSGSKARLAEICGLLAGMLLLTSLLLIGFAPVSWLFSQSTQSVGWMGALHLVFWLVATVFGLRFLSNGFSHSEARSKAGLATWSVIFILVAIQMTTALRPLVGTSKTFFPEGKKFFIKHWSDSLGGSDPAPEKRSGEYD
jgi:hypothetical protein